MPEETQGQNQETQNPPEGTPTGAEGGTGGTPQEGSPQGIEYELSDGSKQVITPERLQKLLEMEGNYPQLQGEYTRSRQENAELRKKQIKPQPTAQPAQEPTVQPTQVMPKLTEDDYEDPEKVASAFNAFSGAFTAMQNQISNLENQLKEATSPEKRREQTEQLTALLQARSLVQDDPVLKNMDEDLALREIDVAVAWADKQNVPFKSYNDAWKGYNEYKQKIGGNAQVEDPTSRTVKRIAQQVKNATTQVPGGGGGGSASTGSVKDQFFAINDLNKQAEFLRDLKVRDLGAYNNLFKEVNAEAPGTFDETGQYRTVIGARPGEKPPE